MVQRLTDAQCSTVSRPLFTAFGLWTDKSGQTTTRRLDRRKRGFLVHSINVDPIGEHEHGEIDTVPVIVETLAAKGRVAPTASNLVTFSVRSSSMARLSALASATETPPATNSIRLIDIG